MQQPATRFIDPASLARLTSLELLARAVVEGFLAGLHRSPYKGFSVDFMEYRPYVPGDDLRRMDWKVFARTDRYFVKEYEGETNTRLQLIVDTSRSMSYTSHTITKLEYSCYIAASIAFLAGRQRDATGLTLFDTQVHTYVPPKASRAHLNMLLSTLETAVPQAATNMERSLHSVAEQHRRRGFVVLISDLLTDADRIERALRIFRFARHNVLVLQVLDPQEVVFDFKDVVEFLDLESGRKMLVDAKSARTMYQTEFHRFQQRIRKICGLLQADYALLHTDAPLDQALFQYLSARARRKT